MSAWVVVYVAVQDSNRPGASVESGQVMVDKPVIGSVTVIDVRVTFPVFVTKYS
jgi:hypothetical protein